MKKTKTKKQVWLITFLNMKRAMDTIVSITYEPILQKLDIQIPYSPLLNSGLYKKKIISKDRCSLIFNPNITQTRKYGYLPSITIRYYKYPNGKIEVSSFKFQCSVPKVIYDNSYYLTDENDLDLFSTNLSEKFRLLKIPIEPDKIKWLDVSTSASSWNVILPTRIGSPYTFLKRIAFLDYGQHFKNTMNIGYDEHTEGYRCGTYSKNTGHSIYDKGSEIQNRPKTFSEIELAQKLKEKKIPHCILRIEKNLQSKPALRKALYPSRTGKAQPIPIKDLFNNEFHKKQLLDMVGKLGKTVNLVAIDVSHKDNFLSVERAIAGASRLGLKGTNAIFFSLHSLAIGQMGVKNANALIDRELGRAGQRYRSKLASEISKELEQKKFKDFFLVDLFEVIKEQIEGFKPYKNEEQTKALQKEVEVRDSIRASTSNEAIKVPEEAS